MLARRRDPEEGAGGPVGLVEIAVRDAARQTHEVAHLRLDPNTVELEIENALLHQDELVLRWMNMNRHELPGLGVRLEGEGGIAAALLALSR
jgi:hypothetical protein